MRASRALLVLLMLGPCAHAALPDPPHETIHFLAEHLPEAAQDARYLSLPLLQSPLQAGRWRWTVQAGGAQAEAGFMRISGSMLAFAAGRGWSERSGFSLLAFYDHMSVSGGSGQAVLDPTGFFPVPLDVPEWATFSSPAGDFLHWGVGAAWVHDHGRFTTTLGLLGDRLTIDHDTVDYRLESGASAGTVGVLDHSSSATYFTPFAVLQYTRALGARFAITPRLVGAFPLPPGEFDARLTGPGFDLSTARGDGTPGRIGDTFLGIGMGLLHVGSGLEVDLGAAVFYPLFETVSHPGIDRALTLQAAWHW